MKKILRIFGYIFLIAITLVFFIFYFFTENSISLQNGFYNGETGERLDKYLTSITNSGFSGIVLVTKDDNILLSKGYGAANRKKRIPFTDKTVFDIGSITKQFTAAAILKLEMQDKLSVNDKISKYIDGAPSDKADITIHQLLTHSAGFANNLGQDDYSPLKRNEFIKLAMNSKMKFLPGEGFSYSNIGYNLLAAIIEIVTKESYENYLHDNLFEPAAMTRTGNKIPDWNKDSIAIGYYQLGFRWGSPLDKKWDTDGLYWNMRGAEGMLSTADDLHKWHITLSGDKILSKEAKENFFTPYRTADHYGYGWVFSKTSRDTRVIWHDGSNKVFDAYFRWYVDEGVFLVIATNSTRQAEEEIGKIDKIIFENHNYNL